MERSRLINFIFSLGAVLTFGLLCYSLSEALLFWRLCWKQDHDLPPNTEVIVSACQRPDAVGVPAGEVLFAREGRTGDMYILDLRTGMVRREQFPMTLSYLIMECF